MTDAILAFVLVLTACLYGAGCFWLWEEHIEPAWRRRLHDRIRRDYGYTRSQWAAEYPDRPIPEPIVTRLLSLLVPSRSLSWDRLTLSHRRPMDTPTKATSERISRKALRWQEYGAIEAEPIGPLALYEPGSFVTLNGGLTIGAGLDAAPSWHSLHPEPWDDGTIPRAVPPTGR